MMNIGLGSKCFGKNRKPFLIFFLIFLIKQPCGCKSAA